MGTARTRANNKWNAKAYDRLNIVIPKGKKTIIEDHAKSKGETVNGLVNNLLRADLGMTEEEWKERLPE